MYGSSIRGNAQGGEVKSKNDSIYKIRRLEYAQ